MKLKVLVGAGDRVMGLALPFFAAGLASNLVRPDWFRMGSGTPAWSPASSFWRSAYRPGSPRRCRYSCTFPGGS